MTTHTGVFTYIACLDSLESAIMDIFHGLPLSDNFFKASNVSFISIAHLDYVRFCTAVLLVTSRVSAFI